MLEALATDVVLMSWSNIGAARTLTVVRPATMREVKRAKNMAEDR
jgi:hypothetical protein